MCTKTKGESKFFLSVVGQTTQLLSNRKTVAWLARSCKFSPLFCCPARPTAIVEQVKLAVHFVFGGTGC